MESSDDELYIKELEGTPSLRKKTPRASPKPGPVAGFGDGDDTEEEEEEEEEENTASIH